MVSFVKLTTYYLVFSAASIVIVLALPQPLAEEVALTSPAPLPVTHDETAQIKPLDHIPLTSADLKPPTTHIIHNNVEQDIDANNKELVDYGDEFMDAMYFVQSEKMAGNDSAKVIEAMIAKHHNNEELHQYLFELHQKYPDITHLYNIGESVEKRKLWVLEITENPGKHLLLKPEFKYVANMHGNEVVGRELLLHLARLLVENYRASQDEPTGDTKPTSAKFVRKLLQATRIHIMPSMNPDGYAKSAVSCKHEKPSERGRLNANNIDLNRNFPDPVQHTQVDPGTQPEVKAMIQWSNPKNPFILSANLHGGALVASYPYDGVQNTSKANEYRATPDDDIFRHLAKTYSQSHPTMYKGEICYDECSLSDKNVQFTDGITNGANWYSLYGGMQDWMYEHTNSFEITLELGCNQYPHANTLPRYWHYNKRALLNYIKEVHRGIKGTIIDAVSGAALPNVIIHVLNRPHNVTSTIYGDYYRILLPGTYEIIYDKKGYIEQKISVRVTSSMAQIIHIKLQPTGGDKGNGSISGPDATSHDEFEPTEIVVGEPSDHSLVVAILVMTTIIMLIMIMMGGAYIIQKRRFTKVRSMSMEMQPARTSLSATGTGVSLPSNISQQPQSPSGSSTNPHLSP